MTYTVICRDPSSGVVGIGIATYSLAVGATCPHARAGVGAVSTQAATNERLGPELLDLLQQGDDVESAFSVLENSDQYFQYRQIGLVTWDGQAAVHTGSSTRDWKGSVTGEGWLVMGNVLSGAEVVDAMADTCRSGSEMALPERILAVLEAGRDAGGQKGSTGHLPERSSALIVQGSATVPVPDLRVDDHPTAVDELRRIHARFARASTYYAERSSNPDRIVAQDVWMRDNGIT